MRDKAFCLRWVVLLFLAVACLATNAAAQYGTANLVGTVRDPSGAVVPGARVTVSDASRGFVRHLVTDSSGSYAISNIPIGTYTVTFEAKGFMKVIQAGVSLSTGQTQRVDAVLKVGAVTQTVSVQGNLPHVQTETAAISSVVTGQEISQLSINGRDFVRLALLVPGAVPDNGLNTSTVGVDANNSISFNGSRLQYNNWTVDGAPNTDEGSASTFNTYPNLDSIAEFRISTSNYGAEYGHHSGAQIDVATKSGTSQFHGDAFDYLRNDVLDAQNWFTNANDLTGTPPARAPLKQNEYGFTFGGPFYIPGFYNTKKNKTFFFWSEDWRKIRGSNVLSNGVPSLLQRKGDLSQCDPNNPMGGPGNPKVNGGKPGIGFDAPYNGVVASGCVLPTLPELDASGNPVLDASGNPIMITYDNVNAIPASQLPGTNIPQAMTNATDWMAAFVPTPNEGGSAPTSWTASAPAATNWREDQIRVDQNISSKMRAFVRFTHDAWDTTTVPTLWGWSSYDTVQTPFSGPGKSAVLNLTNTFSPTLMNEFIAGYTEDWITLLDKAGPDSVGLNRPSNFQLAHFFPANDSNPELPGIAVCGGGPCFFEEGYGAGAPWNNSNPIVDFSDNMTKVRGNMILKFGAYLEDYHKNEQFGTATQGTVEAANWGSTSTGNGLADLFLGRVASYYEGTQTVNAIPVGGYAKGHWQYWDFEPYIEDDWHVNSRLTLNFGMRYYLFTHIHDTSNPTVDSGFLPQLYNPAAEAQYDSNGNLIQGTGALPTAYGNGLVECGHGGIPLGCQTNTYNNWAPRLGFAYRLGHNTSVRGGYGIFYEIGNGNEAESEGGEGNPPYYLTLTGSNFPNYESINSIFSNGVYSAPIPPASYTNWPYHQKWPSEQQFSLSVEHQFAHDNLVSLAYVGMLGHHLAMGYPNNNIPLGLGTVNVPQLAGANKYCDASGNCDAQNYLIHNTGTGVFFQPYRGYSGITTKADIANSNYNSLQAEFRHTFGHGLTTQVSYTWSHNLDDASSTYTSGGRSVDPFFFDRWYGTSDLNRSQVFTAAYIYSLPFFKNAGNAFVRQGLAGWEFSGITTFMTGQPVTFTCGVNGFSTGIGGSMMCNTVGKLQIDKGTFNDVVYGPRPTWYNPGVIAQPLQSQLYANGEPGMFGYIGRNLLTGPGRDDTDLTLLKTWKVSKLGEGGAIQFRWETYNTFNHPQWSGFNLGCSGSDTFGQACNNPSNDLGYAGANGEVTSAFDPRIMQFGLTIKW